MCIGYHSVIDQSKGFSKYISDYSWDISRLMQGRKYMKYYEKRDIDLFMDFLRKQGVFMKPISLDEINHLKQLVSDNNLPDTYLTFMKNAGNGIRFFRGSSYAMSEINNIKLWAQELLEEDCSTETLTTNDFVFFMHQGYQFYFFRLNEGDNPPVYFYEEGENSQQFIKKYDSFVDFLIESYNDVEHLIKTDNYF